MRRAAAALLLLGAPALGVFMLALPADGARRAPNPVRELRDAERAQAAGIAAQREAAERARTAQAEERRLAESRVGTAQAVQEADAQVADAAARVDALVRRRGEAQARLLQRAQAMEPLLPLAVRLGLFPAETVLAAPGPPEAALRGLLVLRGLTRQLETEAAALRTEQAEVANLQLAMEAEMPALRAAQAEQARRGAELDRQFAASQAVRRAAEDAGTEATRRAAAEGARAETLRGVLAGIEADRQRQDAEARRQAEMEARRTRLAARAAPDQPQQVAMRLAPLPQSPGPPASAPPASAPAVSALPASATAPLAAPDPARTPFSSPVAGRVVRGWGERAEGGPANGLSYRAPPAARVVAPCGGRIVFAGAFRSFGPMLILDCGGGYHVVLAGLDRLDAQVGHPVQSGEPVGTMPAWDPRAAGDRPTLYVELRRDGQPVNPAPFLRARG